MSRSVSIFSVVVVMTITVLATVVVAFAQEDPLEEPENEGGGGPVGKVSVCHNTKHNPHTITVGAPAEAAHLAHGDTAGACAEDALEPGTPEPPEGTTLTTEATPTPTDGTISDTATLGADVPDGTDGDIEFKLYGPFTTAPTAETAATDCVAANLVDNPSYTSTVAVDDHTAGDTYPSATYTPTDPGIYQWTATFTPDAGQGDPSGEIGCGEAAEQSVVSDGEAPTTSTEQNMTLAGEIGEATNLADPATDTTNIEGTTQNDNTTLGTDSNDDLIGDSSANVLLGREGSDILDGATGQDRMVGGRRNDYINGADGKPGDVLNGGVGKDFCVGDKGDDFRNCDGNVKRLPLPSEAAAPAEARN